jgi:hypothetical protein
MHAPVQSLQIYVTYCQKPPAVVVAVAVVVDVAVVFVLLL